MKHIIAIFAAALLFNTQAAFADFIKIEYSGVLESLYKSNQGSGSFVSSADINGLNFSAGQHFLGSFSYDSSVSPSPYDTPDDGLQIYSGGVLDYLFSIVESGYTFSATSGNVSLSAGLVPPIYTKDSISFFAPISWSPYINSMVYLSNPTDNSVFSDYSLPELMPLERLPYRSLYFEYLYSPTNEFLSFRSNIDKLQVANAVPEPSTFQMLLLGFGVLAWNQRRARHK